MSYSPTCTHCGEALYRDDVHCPNCGLRRPDAVLASAPTVGATRLLAATAVFQEGHPPACPACGAPRFESDTFCAACGTPVSDVEGPSSWDRETQVASDFQPDPASHASAPPEEPEPEGWREVRDQLQKATEGEFQIVGELGRGGMAKVYMARDLSLGRNVAIKVMAPGLLMGPGMVERFRQEAVTVANLQHPNIVTIHTVRQAGNLHFFVMQLVEGSSLETILKRPEPIPILLTQVILYQLGAGLSFAHRRGVIHRDIKPANVLLDREGNAILTDFGIAKVATAANLTQTGATMGTPAYMSPEQCRAGELSGASDQYSLGVVAYEMLTGEPPFRGSPFEIMQAHTAEPPPAIRDRRPGCSPELEAAVLRMLSKDPNDRFPDVAQAIEAIGGFSPGPQDPVREDLVHLVRSGESPPSREAVYPRPTPDQGEGRRTLSFLSGLPARIAAAVVVLAALAVGTVALWPGSVEEPAPSTSIPPSIAEIAFPNPMEEILVGASVRIAGSLFDSLGQPIQGQSVEWRSGNLDVASVEGSSEEVLMTGIGAGETTIFAQAGSVEGSFRVVVSAPAAGELTVNAPTRELLVGDRTTLNAILTDASGRRVEDAEVSWRSSDPSVLEVDSRTGVATGRGLGRARATATAGERSSSVEMAVVGRVESIVVAPPRTSLEAGGTTVLRSSVTARPAGYLGPEGIQWSSSDSSVASIFHAAGDSVVLGLQNPGEAVVTARSGAIRGTVSIQVTPPAPPITLELSQSSVSFEAVQGGDAPEAVTVTLTVTGGVAPEVGPPEHQGGSGSWLSTRLGRTQGQATPLTLQVDLRGLQAGVYVARVPIGAGQEREQVEVRLTVAADPAAGPVEPNEMAAQQISALLSEYANAINAKNTNLVREIFPSLPQEALNDLVGLPATDTYYLQLAPGSLRLGSREETLDGDVMSGVLGRDNRGELVRWIYTFGRSQRGWYIVSLRPGSLPLPSLHP